MKDAVLVDVVRVERGVGLPDLLKHDATQNLEPHANRACGVRSQARTLRPI